MDLVTQLQMRRAWAEKQAFQAYRSGHHEKLRHYNNVAMTAAILIPSALDYGGK